MKALKRIVFVGCVLTGAWLLFVLTFVPHVIQYRRFQLRGQAYYSSVAAACDEVLAKGAPEWKSIKRDDLRSLPTILRDLHPDHVSISPRGLILSNGGTWDGIILYWVAGDDDPTHWHLIIRHGESHGREVYSIVRPQPFSQR